MVAGVVLFVSASFGVLFVVDVISRVRFTVVYS